MPEHPFTDFKSKCLCVLQFCVIDNITMFIMIFRSQIVCNFLSSLTSMIVAKNVQDNKSLDRNMIPYKTVYDVLKCETKVLYECDPDYSDRNDKETRRLFDKSCQPIMANNPCSKSEDGGDDWIWKGLGIAAGVGLFLYLLYECINFWRKEYNTEFIAKEAYKAEKFRQKYEKEYIRAVYDHEVDIQDKQYFTNAPKQTSENGEAQPIKKQENVKIPKKDLKKNQKENQFTNINKTNNFINTKFLDYINFWITSNNNFNNK
ncbi:hypothetical protein DERP_002440 [Dermatophagoides pteronyssinus]|uniref:Transmembrane protein n=1 Tax=Dermatophagoides pteronyssinus TaxID=6956 RepID=A0ABQ8JIA9_DERPT|nr:hypothetical protein DERP_002440 [Dermatophagoides pteronyssinus]